MADVSVPWEKITRGLPRGRRYSDDRAPTIDEIRKLCEYPDRRIKPLVYTMVSSGIRVGAWDYLHWGFTYITPSAYRELAEWMKYREESGEIITDDSWVMRDLWDTQVKISKGLVTIPKQLTSVGVKRLMERAIWAQMI
jgi:hypothetical protein